MCSHNSLSKEEKEHFDNLAVEKGFHWWGNTTKAGQLRQEIRAQLAREYLASKIEGDILEVGCGAGDFTRYLGRFFPAASITAFDISSKLIEIAAKRSVTDNVHFVVGNTEELPYSGESFDCVVGNAVLHHLDLSHVLPEVKRVLKRQGKLFFTEPNMLNPQVFLEKNFHFIGARLGNSPDETAFFRWKIKRILASFGFTNIRVIPFDFLHPLVPEGLINLVCRLSGVLERVPIIKEISGSLIISARKEGP